MFKYIDLSSICCTSIITSPKANSTAEKIRKKNVNESRFTLSNINPTNNTMIYNEIHRSSAVSNRCRAVFIFITMVRKKKKNRIKIKFKSPNIIFFKDVLRFLNIHISIFPVGTIY